MTKKTGHFNPKRTEDGLSALYFAALGGYLETCQYIAENVDDKNPGSNDGRTPLHSAACIGHLDVCTLLIQNIGKAMF